MSNVLPNDADGDALRALIETGSDLTKEMEIEFAVRVANEVLGEQFAREAQSHGFRAWVSQDIGFESWTCYCARIMIPAYPAIVRIQGQLAQIAIPFNATPDGWGTFGNSPRDHHVDIGGQTDTAH